MCFIPVYLHIFDHTIVMPLYLSRAFALAPVATPVIALKSPQLPDTASLRESLTIGYGADDLEILHWIILTRKPPSLPRGPNLQMPLCLTSANHRIPENPRAQQQSGGRKQ